LMKGSLHTDEVMGAVVARRRHTHIAPDQSLLHHGRTRPSRSFDHH
jgi:hypothetical protein